MPVADTKTKSLIYRRAVWLGKASHGKSVQELVVAALDKLPNIEHTQVVRGEQTYEIRHKRKSDNSASVKPLTYLHISGYTPNGAASTVPKATGPNDADLSSLAAPANADFLDGDLMALFHGNDVAICVSNSSEGALYGFLIAFLKKAGYPGKDLQFELQRVGNRAALKKVLKAGVREITLDFVAYQTSLDANKTKSFSALRKGFGAVFGQDQKVGDIIDKAGVQALVTLKASGRVDHGSGQISLADVAADVLDEEASGFTIITKSGDRISPEEMMVRRSEKIQKHNKTIDYKDAWEKLKSFYEYVDDNKLNDF